MENKENGRVDAMDQFAQKITDAVKFAQKNKLKIVLVSIYQNPQSERTAIAYGGMSKEKSFFALSHAIADEFADVIENI
jgi:hypothetical protein